MSFNPKTFPLEGYTEIVFAWLDIHNALGEGEPAIYLPIGTKKEADQMRFTFHRVRAAIRAQHEEKDKYDYIIVRVAELNDGNWGLEFKDRNEDIPKLVLHNADGEPLNG